MSIQNDVSAGAGSSPFLLFSGQFENCWPLKGAERTCLTGPCGLIRLAGTVFLEEAGRRIVTDQSQGEKDLDHTEGEPLSSATCKRDLETSTWEVLGMPTLDFSDQPAVFAEIYPLMETVRVPYSPFTGVQFGDFWYSLRAVLLSTAEFVNFIPHCLHLDLQALSLT